MPRPEGAPQFRGENQTFLDTAKNWISDHETEIIVTTLGLLVIAAVI